MAEIITLLGYAIARWVVYTGWYSYLQWIKDEIGSKIAVEELFTLPWMLRYQVPHSRFLNNKNPYDVNPFQVQGMLPLNDVKGYVMALDKAVLLTGRQLMYGASNMLPNEADFNFAGTTSNSFWHDFLVHNRDVRLSAWYDWFPMSWWHGKDEDWFYSKLTGYLDGTEFIMESDPQSPWYWLVEEGEIPGVKTLTYQYIPVKEMSAREHVAFKQGVRFGKSVAYKS